MGDLSLFAQMLSSARRTFSSLGAHAARATLVPSAEPVDLTRAGRAFDATSVAVFRNVVTESESSALLDDCETSLRRRRYQAGHWDQVIEKYKEVEKLAWAQENDATIARIRSLIQDYTHGGQPVTFLPVHVIDLADDGYIKPHVDSVKFSGGFVAGLSLLSSCVMRLQSEKDPTSVIDLLLEPRSLYIMQRQARYEYAHAILEGGDAESNRFKGQKVERSRRISLIFRDVHPSDEQTGSRMGRPMGMSQAGSP